MNSIDIYFEEKPISEAILKENRYFIQFESFIRKIGGKIEYKDNTIYIFNKSRSPVYLENDNLILINKIKYISLFELCRILNLTTKWEYVSSIIFLELKNKIHKNSINKNTVPAFLRLEDFTAEDMYLDSDNLEKMRILADYLYMTGVPFHIAWIPRFIDPLNGIDNDISKNYNMPNAHFLFTLEYFLDHNGLIGLHGYTHQFHDEISGEGTEFNKFRNNDEVSIRERITAAIGIADNLGLPYCFFESPHYASTAFQQSIYEQYFDAIYEGYVGIWNKKIIISPRNNRTIYIPTPLGYLENGLDDMLTKIKNLDEDSLASLFYHPYSEFDYINNNYYSEASPLHQIINEINNKQCIFKKITDI